MTEKDLEKKKKMRVLMKIRDAVLIRAERYRDEETAIVFGEKYLSYYNKLQQKNRQISYKIQKYVPLQEIKK